MPYVVAAVVFVGALAGLNLLLTLGVVKRLREHTALLANGAGTSHGDDLDLIPVGEQIGDFVATTVNGERLARQQPGGDRLVGFLKPGCGPCEELMPEFIRLAGEMPGGQERVLAVVVGSGGEAAPLVAQLSGVARVAVELLDGPLCRAFRVDAFPTYILIDAAGTVRGASYRPSQLPVPQPT